MNQLIKHNKLIINIIGLLILFFCFDVYFDYYFTDSIKYYIDEVLIYLGIKERPKEEPFIGMIASMLGTVGSIFAMAAIPVLFITLATRWVINLGIGIGEAIYGTLMTLIKGSFQVVLSLPEIGIFILYIVRWFIDHILCFIQLIFSLPSCIFFYIAGLIGQILYLPFRAMFFLIFILGFSNIYDLVDKAWDSVYKLDDFIFKYVVPIHFAHWPQNIRDKCFTCVRLKMDSVGNKYMPVHRRYGVTIPRVVGSDVRIAGRGWNRIIKSFTSFP